MRGHRKGWRTLALAVMSVMVLMLANTASAVHALGLFELDGNAIGQAAAGDDWSTVAASSDTVATTAIPIADSDSPTDVSYYKGGGSKDVNDVSQWKYSATDVAPDKDEILNAFAAAYRPASDLIIYFGADRFANDGDAQIGFWFFKNNITLDADGTFNGVHANGDLLVLSDFTGGGKISSIKVYKWNGSGLDTVSFSNTVVECDDPALPATDDVCGIENPAGTETAPWSYTPKSGSSGVYPTGSFYEGGINYTDLVPGGDPCFASFLAETRSSQSPTAQLKDFALGAFPVCAPSTDLSVTAPTTVEVHSGGSATFNFTELNDGDVVLTSPSVTSQDCTVTQVTSGGFNTGDGDQDGKLDIGETWNFRCTVSNVTTNTTITVTGSGVDPAGRTVTYCVTPPNDTTICDADEQATASIVVINPSTDLTLDSSTPSPKQIHSGDTVVFKFNEANDGDRDLTSPGATGTNCTAAQVLVSGFNAGDTDQDGKLDVGETWQYTCTATNVTADTTVALVATGTDPLGGIITWCSNPASPPTNVLCDQDERKTASIDVIVPSTTMSAAVSATFTFTETNDGDVPLTSPSVSSTDCTIAQVLDGSGDNVGDSNSDGVLDVGESWQFRCTVTQTGAGTKDVEAKGAGTDPLSFVVKYCVIAGTNEICDAQEIASGSVTID